MLRTVRQSVSVQVSSQEYIVHVLQAIRLIYGAEDKHRSDWFAVVDGIKRADRDNAIDVYISDEYMDVLADGVWEKTFKVKPEVFTKEEQRAWLDKNTDVALGSDAFFPFGDNIERAKKSGVTVIAQPGGSIRDDNVIETCNKYNMCMSFTGIRLFHH